MWHAANLAFDLCPLLTQGAIEAIELRGTEAAQGKIPAEDGGRHVDRHDESHRTAGRVRSRRGAHARGAARRRHVQAVRPEDLHHLRRARLHRKHHPPGARAHAGCAGRRQGHLAVRRAQGAGQRRWHARRAQRRALRVDRTQARHPREPDRGAGLRGQGRRGRLPRRRGESRPRVHVHHDESRALFGRDGRCGHFRACVPARGRVRARSGARQGGRTGQGRERRHDHRASGHPAHADDDARVYRSRARGRLCHGGRAGQCFAQSGSGGARQGTRRSPNS